MGITEVWIVTYRDAGVIRRTSSEVNNNLFIIIKYFDISNYNIIFIMHILIWLFCKEYTGIMINNIIIN